VADHGAETTPQTGISNEVDRSTDDNDARRQAFHPMLTDLIGLPKPEVTAESLDPVEGLRELERFAMAADFLAQAYAGSDMSPQERALSPLFPQNLPIVDRLNNQFAKKIVPCFIQMDVRLGLQNFRGIIPNTTDEEMILLTNDVEFSRLHEEVGAYLAARAGDIAATIADNQVEIARADRMQFSGNPKRSLEQVMESGMVITFDTSAVEVLRRANELAGEGILPLSEYVKNEKILGVSGFMGSKISLAVHDFMDHIWTFDLIEQTGILDNYREMFDSIGNPELTDIFKREGEAVSSIAFGVRLHQTMPSAFGPLMRSSMIEEHMDKLLVEGKLGSRHMGAYRTLKSLRKGSVEWQSLGFSFSNYITELDEQRRKYGKIKQRDPQTRRLVGELDPLEPDYLCFFIDTHHEILSSKNKHRNDLFRFHILLEQYLTSIANGDVPEDQPLTILPRQFREIDYSQTTLPPKRLQWMRNNYGFTATRDEIV
jgi:hypothetical protein